MSRATLRPPLSVGDRFNTLLGHRRLLYVGDTAFFQRESRRYRTRVVSAKDVPRKDAWGEWKWHRWLTVEVIEV